MMFVDYTFSLAGEHIMMDRELDPNHVKIKDGDRFMAKIKEVHHDGKILQQITFVKHPDDMSDMPLEQG
tara:strand:+ start:822 stop:1028 length:207 start_codon:yes stop_codon:yes gene_type:complete